MRTPIVMIIGIVLAPCGLVLDLTSTVAPDWRQLSNLNGLPSDVVVNQGLWDICQQTVTSNSMQCGQTNTEYFNLQVVHVAQGLMVTSLVVTAIGIVLASFGVRCWQDEPNYLLAGLGGIVIFISGILCLIPISWYNNAMYDMGGTGSTTNKTIAVGYCLVLGYIGSCLEIIGGFSLSLSLVHCCKKCMRNKGSSKSTQYYQKKNQSVQSSTKPTYPDPTVYNIRSDSLSRDPYPSGLGYSVGNDNYRYGNGSRNANSLVSSPRSYINPMDVTEGERPKSHGRPGSQLSSLPCDSDLL
ncbi:claudin-23 [Pelodytes ibericus]